MAALDHSTIKVGTCRQCWGPVFIGTVEGFRVQASSTPLSLEGMIAAKQRKQWLYEVRILRGTRKMELWVYGREAIASAREAIVVTDHSCDPYRPEHIDGIGAEKLHQFLNPEPPPAMFEPPF